MAQTKVKLVSNGVITVDNLHTNHGITTDHIGEGSVLYYTDARVQNYLTTNNYITNADVASLETTTSISLSSSTLSYIDESGTTTNIDLSSLGYLTSFTETDPIYTASSWYTTTNNSSNWDTAYSWGDHSLVGYLTTETDPIFSASAAAGITSTNITNWNTAYGWGDHSTQSYATETYVNTAIANLVDTAPTTLDTLNELAAALGDDPNFATTVSTSIGTKWTQDNTKISNWDTAYGWGNHASAGYQPASTAITTSNIGSQSVNYATSAGNSSTLGGYSPNQTGGANTIVQRDSNGYIQNSYFYTSGGGSERGTNISYVAGFNSSDYYIRSYTMQGLASAMSGATMNIAGNSQTSNHLNTTRDTPSSSLQYWQAPSLGIDEAPNGDWHNTIRMGHGSPLSYYSNTLAIRMTGSGPGDIYTQCIQNGVRQGWKKHWNDANMDAPNKSGTSYYQANTWIQLNGYHGLYAPSWNSAHFYPNNATYGSWRIAGSRNGWHGIHFDSNMTLMMNNTECGFHREGDGWYLYSSSKNLYSPGDVTAYWSDKRLKKNIKPINNGLEKTLALIPCEFEWNEKASAVNENLFDGKKEVSLIAQEVQEVIPDAVTENLSAKGDNEEKYLTIKYDKIVPYLIQAIKEQQQQIEELKQLIKKQ